MGLHNNGSPITPGVPTEEEQKAFDQIYAFLADGGEFLGNFWVNPPGEVSHYEMRVRYNGEVVTLKSARCFPYMFSQ